MKLSSMPGPLYPRVSFQECPAKTWSGSSNGFSGAKDEVHLGRGVQEHCAIVCAVAQELISRLPMPIRSLFPDGAAFAAGCHDIGKVSPYFYEKIRRACTHGAQDLIPIPWIDPHLESAWGGHAGISQLCAKHLGAPKWVPEVLGNHHGRSPPIAARTALSEQAGGVEWQEERQSLVLALSEQFGLSWPTIKTPNQARLVSGLATVSDWIGSGRRFEDPAQPWKGAVSVAVDEAGFVPPVYRQGLSFEDVFGFSPRPAQSSLIASIQGPGAYVFEAPMGVGKTEAALYAAYRMLETGQASGVYFALPTQLTSNKIQDRFEPFLDRVLAESCRHRSWLLHASSWMEEVEQGEDARPGGAWFSQAKRGLLAPFAVGTIDQALMGVMRVKHGFVRAFGLAGKVVILDEVHTYDAYTGTLLDKLVEMLRELGCTVIILSATLDSTRRQALLPGAGQSSAYPLITSHPSSPHQVAHQLAVPVPVTENKEVSIKMVSAVSAAMDEALQRAQSGQQVLWIENTVAKAQERFRELSARAAGTTIECGLLHSRFTAFDRARIEKKWVHLFGKSGWTDRRDRGRILVGTQILEQSLDLDADFMVSDFAPTDMLLQRLGRLWRHAATPRPTTASRPEAWWLAPSLDRAIVDPVDSFGSSSFVYPSYVLCRSLRSWHGKQKVSLPGDIRPLIEDTYDPRVDPDLEEWFREMEEGRGRHNPGRKRLRSSAASALSEYGNVDEDDDHATRFGDRPVVQWLLASDIDIDDGVATHMTFLNGERIEIPHMRSALSKGQWRTLAVAVARQIVSVPATSATTLATVSQVKQYGLHHVCYLGDDRGHDPPSQVQLAIVALDTTLSVHPNSAAPSASYDSALGHQVLSGSDQ